MTLFLFFFNDTAPTEIYTLSLHDALPIYPSQPCCFQRVILWCSMFANRCDGLGLQFYKAAGPGRSEEHTSELQSHSDLVCRLLLEKKKKKKTIINNKNATRK